MIPGKGTALLFIPRGLKDEVTKVRTFVAGKVALTGVGIDIAIRGLWFVSKAIEKRMQNLVLETLTREG